MQQERLSYKETARQFDIPPHNRVAQWERFYIEDGPKWLYIERCNLASAANCTRRGRPPKLDKKVKEDLIAEVQRLRAENAYLKN